MNEVIRCISPGDGTLVAEREVAGDDAIAGALERGCRAQATWKRTPLAERKAMVERFVAHFESQKEEIAKEITRQMGRPIVYSPGEIRGLAERARYMAAIADESLADLSAEPKPGFTRFIRREPVGLVYAIAPWNYPLLTAVNVVVPAVLAGNAVILKHSPFTPLCAERFRAAFAAAGLPDGVFQFLHLSDSSAEKLVAASEVDFVAFTGSVAVGHKVQRAASSRFIGVGLELGGKDPAYVRADADFDHAVENLVDGAFFNSGQSCCAIERIYVHGSLYDRFVEAFVSLTQKYVLGDPLDPRTTLGPVVRESAARKVRAQIADAKAKGAKALIDEGRFTAAKDGTPFVAPQVLVNVSHKMALMTEETFGPAIGIQRVTGDDEAVALMNDSAYGLTAAIWTSDATVAQTLGDRLDTGTVFMNRCDYLDPALAWTGVKDSGHGCTLSRLGYNALTRPKSFHLRTQTK
jgi:acyl-CoA reductase-like NAD-dependent aldehyde dehydrogenase